MTSRNLILSVIAGCVGVFVLLFSMQVCAQVVREDASEASPAPLAAEDNVQDADVADSVSVDTAEEIDNIADDLDPSSETESSDSPDAEEAPQEDSHPVPQAPTQTYVTLTAPMVELKAGPAQTYDTLLEAYEGDKLEVIELRGDWIKVQFTGNDFSWISSAYVTKEDDTGTVTGNNVRVRAGNGLNFEQIGTLNSGYEVTILKELPGWYKIRPVDGAYAWVNKSAVSQEDLQNLAIVPAQQTGGTPAGETAEDGPVEIPEGMPADLNAAYEEAVTMIDEELEKDITEWNFDEPLSYLTAVIDKAESVVLKLKASKKIQLIREKLSEKEEYLRKQKVIEELRKELQDIEEKYSEGYSENGAETPEVTVETVIKGTVEPVYTNLGPYNYKLVDPETGTILYVLESVVVDLDEYVDKTVTIRGEEFAVEGYPITGLDVDEVTLETE